MPRLVGAALGAAALVACAQPAATVPATVPATAPDVPPAPAVVPAAVTTNNVESTVQNSVEPFVGNWRSHAFTLLVREDGTAVADWRTYRWCSGEALPPCDALVAGRITPGGHASLALHAAAQDWAAGEVLESTDPESVPLNAARLRLASGGRLRLFLGPAGSEALRAELCGSRSGWSAGCGA